MPGREWTPGELVLLAGCTTRETELRALASKIGRSFDSVKSRKLRLLNPPPPKPPRPRVAKTKPKPNRRQRVVAPSVIGLTLKSPAPPERSAVPALKPSAVRRRQVRHALEDVALAAELGLSVEDLGG